ncbi:hypothetical protein NQT65_18890 [Pseudoalteromonas agarivorans]|uniref:hypothetical protein n=1 Tax=Pseudoalteromonas agarivorans TaxID=176102 RepID=UPI0021173860|nr:hypothetical protein [Pseudoalteromonas agarivorans]MCQ8822260.1 hypothetical protein [Pseudoalteromonas agarivorans]
MEKENKNNRLIKGLWSLTALKSSDYIRMAKQLHPDLTGSRLRGLMSGISNRNYRPATNHDVFLCVVVVSHWAGIDSGLVETVSDSAVETLLDEVDRLIANADTDHFSNQERVKKALGKLF